MNQKQVIFNVGGALSVYTEWDGRKLLVDLGSSTEFSPVLDFLLPLYKTRGSESVGDKAYELRNKMSVDAFLKNSEKFYLDQLIISHPHKDHISAIKDFDEHFHPYLLTCPSNNRNEDGSRAEESEINWNIIGNGEDESIITLRKMLEGRCLPLRSAYPDVESIYYLNPRDVENSPELMKESYPNNISIVVMLNINGHQMLIPGDLQKVGMETLIAKYPQLRDQLNRGISVLIAPHHGLESSFSTVLFDNIPNNQTTCLNIVSEKPNNPDESRDVDSRYSSSDYCMGLNNLPSANGIERCCQRKTSNGHICIDYGGGDQPKFQIINDNQELISWFLRD